MIKNISSDKTRLPFGIEIKMIRKSKDMTIRSVAEKSGISHSYLSQIENGHREIPQPKVLKKIAVGLEMDYYSLMRTAGHLDFPVIEDEKERDYTNMDFENLLSTFGSACANDYKEDSLLLKSIILNRVQEWEYKERELKRQCDNIENIKTGLENAIEKYLVIQTEG